MTTSTSQFSISGATPTPSPASGSQKPDPIFSPGASPPLILAFLAIGLFTVSMIGVFGWRRVQYGRLTAPDPTWLEINDSDAGKRRDIGPRPKLWDMWTTVASPSGTKGQAHERETEWETIMPLAVMAISASDSHTPADVGGDGTGSASRTWLPIASVPVRYYQWTRRPERSATPTSTHTTGSAATSQKATAQQEPGLHDAGRLQVAVAIAMPSRRTIPNDMNTYGDEHCREGNGTGPKTDDTLEYTLGVYDCAWKHENG